MTKEREALKLALDVLISYRKVVKKYGYAFEKGEAAITKIKEALVEPEQEAWHDKIIGIEVSMDVSTGEDDAYHRVFGRVYEVMLEKCGALNDIILAIEDARNFTTPPKREWVGLMDEDIDAVTKAQWGGSSGQPLAAHRAYARVIEAKLKELNHD